MGPQPSTKRRRSSPSSNSRRLAMRSSEPAFSPPPRFAWPPGQQCAAMLCFDVDGETTALSEDPALARRRTLMSQCEYGPRVGVPRLLGLLAHLKLTATFFVPGYIAETHPRMLEAIVA